LLIAAFIFWTVSIILLDRERTGLSSEQILFVETFEAASALKEYWINPSKENQRKIGASHLRSLSRTISEDWSLNFKLAEEAIGPVKSFVTDLRDKVLYSVENGTHEQVSNALAFVERLAWFLLNEHPTVADLPTVSSSSPLATRPLKKTLLGRGFGWIRKQPGTRVISIYSVFGAIAGLVAFEVARSLGVEVNYAWESAIAVFLVFLGYSWKKS